MRRMAGLLLGSVLLSALDSHQQPFAPQLEISTLQPKPMMPSVQCQVRLSQNTNIKEITMTSAYCR